MADDGHHNGIGADPLCPWVINPVIAVSFETTSSKSSSELRFHGDEDLEAVPAVVKLFSLFPLNKREKVNVWFIHPPPGGS